MNARYTAVILITGLVWGSLGAASAAAQGRGRGQGQGRSNAGPPPVVQFEFDTRDRDLIQRHFAATTGLPPGLAKRGGALPPGLEKQLRRNGRLPPGLQKRIQPFPRGLLDQLRPLPPGYRYGVIGEHVVVYRADNFLVSDVILHVVR